MVGEVVVISSLGLGSEAIVDRDGVGLELERIMFFDTVVCLLLGIASSRM
jgi:hypothetical protein